MSTIARVSTPTFLATEQKTSHRRGTNSQADHLGEILLGMMVLPFLAAAGGVALGAKLLQPGAARTITQSVLGTAGFAGGIAIDRFMLKELKRN